MRAVRLSETGAPDVLGVDEVADPQPGEGEALVRLAAAGLNFIDTYERSGAYPLELPATPGREGAGTVLAVGTGVSGLTEGDRVAWASAPGSYAELVLVPASQAVAVPDDVDLVSAAAALLQGMTADYLARDTYALKEGDTALVYAAAGGVGRLLVQLACERGARVIALTSTDEKEALAREAGADEVVRYRDVDVPAAVAELTDGRGVDVVYDSVGADTFADSLACLRPRGLMVLYGQSSGRVDPVDPQLLNSSGSLYLTRPTLVDYTRDRAELQARAERVLGAVATRRLDVRIDRTWPFEEAADAHAYLEAGRTKGKLLLVP